MKLDLAYSLILGEQEILLPSAGRKTDIKSEGKENRKTSLNGTIHQAFTRTNTKFSFSWDLLSFPICTDIQNLWNRYNTGEEPLYLRRQKPSGDLQTFEVVMSQPKVVLTEIISQEEHWGSLEMEVVSKQWQTLSF